jgi:mono/diheme cytochrome c family protein
MIYRCKSGFFKMENTKIMIKVMSALILGLAATISFATEGDTPYQVVDGKIDANTFEGWRNFRGGGCGTCHGGAGQGGAGPNLTVSLKEKIDKKRFVETVTNGRPGTLMRPFKTSPRVMDNLDKIYAYLEARSDGVLGPENLIKFPLGKK